MTKFAGIARDAYRRLQADPERRALLAAIDRVLDRLDVNPGDRLLNRHVFTSRAWPRRLRAIEVRGADEDWLVIWTMADDGRPKVVYLGPGPRG